MTIGDDREAPVAQQHDSANWQMVRFRPDHQLYQTGEPIREVWFLASGVVKIWAWAGEKPVPIGVRTPGWVIGATPAIAGSPQVANVTTLTGCLMQRLPVAEFHRLRREYGPFAVWLQEMLARDARDHHERTAALATGRASAVLEALLAQLFRAASIARPDTSRRLEFPLSRIDLAALTGVSRQWLTKLLSDLTAAGELADEKGWLVAPAGSRAARIIAEEGPVPPPR